MDEGPNLRDGGVMYSWMGDTLKGDGVLCHQGKTLTALICYTYYVLKVI